jgi:hypothetical protein
MSNASSKGTVAGRTVTATPAFGERSELPPLPVPVAAAEASFAERNRLLPVPVAMNALAPAALPAPTPALTALTAEPTPELMTELMAEPAPVATADVSPAPAPAPGEGEQEEARRTLERRIRAHLSRGTLSLTLTDNRYTMISVRRETRDGRFQVRLHSMFVDANPMITRALARYIVHNDRESSRLLGEYIDANQHRVRSRSRRTETAIRCVTRGKYHDLQEIFDDLNQRYFGDTIDARITWGQRGGKPRRRNSIKMGSYSVEDRLIRIHRSLDRAFVPRFFVEWIVYHEMLHQVHEIKVVNGRRQFHTREFLHDEARFEHYVAARRWERIHLDALLTC